MRMIIEFVGPALGVARVGRMSAMRQDLVMAGLMGLLLVGCGDRTPPRLDEFAITPPNEQAPLAAVLSLTANEPVAVRVDVSGAADGMAATRDVVFKTFHRILVPGLVSDSTHRVTVTAEDQAGNLVSTEPVTITTVPLPEVFPTLDVKFSDPERMEPGLTIFPVYRWPDGGSIDQQAGLIVALDAQGRVVWYFQADHSIGDVIQLRNGNLLYSTTVDGVRGRFVEIDALGRTVASWHSRSLEEAGLDSSILVDVDSFHHEMVELPSGSLITLSTEVRTFDDYPSSDEDPDAPRGTQDVVGDLIVEFNREGIVERTTSLFDVVDPYRLGYDSLGRGFWRVTYQALMEEEPELADWAHANSLVYDPGSDSYIIGLRHQDALVKLKREAPAIDWILGPHNGWREPWVSRLLSPTEGTEWAYHSHGVDLTPQGTFLLFDNGNNRASAFEERIPAEDAYSRIVEFQIDEVEMEVNEVWSYKGMVGEGFYSSFLSDADWLPTTGNILVDDGARTRSVENGDGETTDHNWARIFELTHTTPAEVVFEVVVDSEPPTGWRVYRAQRISELQAPSGDMEK